jgi:hypothetical protein
MPSEAGSHTICSKYIVIYLDCKYIKLEVN